MEYLFVLFNIVYFGIVALTMGLKDAWPFWLLMFLYAFIAPVIAKMTGLL